MDRQESAPASPFMNTDITPQQIDDYRDQGFLIIEDFLDTSELEMWRAAVDAAIAQRVGPEAMARLSGAEESFYQNVFVQCSNLWKTHEQIRQLVLDPKFSKMTAELAGVEGQRLYHDHAMVKRPWSNATNWHRFSPS